MTTPSEQTHPRTRDDLHLPAGSRSREMFDVSIAPEDVGFEFSGLDVAFMSAGDEVQVDLNEFECAVLPLTGGVVAYVDDNEFVLSGRPSPLTHASDFLYVPRDSHLRLAATESCEVALPKARARRRLPTTYVPAGDVAVELRGAGSASRRLNNFLAPEVGISDRLTAVEVVTPGGNWSSYPPHKHDCETGTEAELEEYYYFRIENPQGFAHHRTYNLVENWDTTVTVRDGDVFLVPSGYHGPCSAAPGYDLYYLNVLAGPGAARSLAFSDDPAHAWIRDSWRDQDPDPRVVTSLRETVQ